MNVFRFIAHFDSEDACRLHFKSERDKVGLRVVVALTRIIIG